MRHLLPLLLTTFVLLPLNGFSATPVHNTSPPATVAVHTPAPKQIDAERLLTRYADALGRKDADAIAPLISPSANVEVLWLDASPPKRFTLSATDYVQQLRALWKFTRNDRHRFGPREWKAGSNGTLRVRLTHNETRDLLGTPSGQENQLELTLANTADGLRITHIMSSTKMW
ncbi:MAG: hypothetical protein Q8J78_12705 [Moraxellaceae bacterium]|nr:hypothetical protein [Moraxellaceae bacterium]